MLSQTEENYLKAIYGIYQKERLSVSTNAIAAKMETAPASVTDMLKKMADKGIVNYEKYKGVTLSEIGLRLGSNLVRKHRLWEVFLYEKLGFGWEEIHEIAEELEHIKSPKLVERLDVFLNYPKYGPHGEPIPDKDGNMPSRLQLPLVDLAEGKKGVVVGVKDEATPFLVYLDKLGIQLGTSLEVISIFDYDGSIAILINNTTEHNISNKVANNILVKPNN